MISEFFILIQKKIKNKDMKDFIKIGIKMEKVFYIIKMEIYMQEILKMIKKMEKEYIILKMEIGKWGIILKIKKLEFI